MTFEKFRAALQHFRAPQCEVLGDKENTEWMVEVQRCVPPWIAFQVLKDGLSITWYDKRWQIIQGYWQIHKLVEEGNAKCRAEKPNCALLTASGMTCYQIMEKAYLERDAR